MNLDELKFADLTPSNYVSKTPAWRNNCTTMIAHPSGRIPSHSAAAGWQPLYSPSRINNQSTTINGLIRRVRKSRGEA